jgi:hypothetical protein
LAVKEAFLSDLEELPSLKIGDFILTIELGELTPEVKEIARKELRETPEVRKQAIVELRDLLRGKNPLHLAYTEYSTRLLLRKEPVLPCTLSFPDTSKELDQSTYV